MPRITIGKIDRNEIETLRDNYTFALEQLSKAYGVPETNIDVLLERGECIACEGYIDTSYEHY
jgi:hypothetical protein